MCIITDLQARLAAARAEAQLATGGAWPCRCLVCGEAAEPADVGEVGLGQVAHDWCVTEELLEALARIETHEVNARARQLALFPEAN